jgi:outer membrane protein OmpA-like peptidoglycan-associated protein
LNAPPSGSERITVVVRLLDLNGKLIQELAIPVSSTTSSLEVPVNLPIGTFTVSAGTSNSSASSQAMTLQADIVKKTWLASPSPEGTLRLAGKAASDPIFFSPNSVSLSKQARSELRQAAKVAKRTNSRVAVTGFSANSGMGTVFEKNIAERRALAVTKFLKAQGVSSWLFFSGFDGAKTAEFSGQPRRVEIRILK